MPAALHQSKFDDATKVVDLFCGIGGLSHGFVCEGFNVVAGIDSDPTCQYAYKTNNGAEFLERDIAGLSSQEVSKLFEGAEIKILVGCAPCQPYSVYNNKIATPIEERNDSKWELLYAFADLIDATEPDIVSMENVPQLLKFNGGKIFNDFKKRLEDRGYKVTAKIVNAQDYGVPQRRKRLVMFASKFGEVQLVDKTVKDGKYKTVRQAIGNLPRVDGGPAHPLDPIHRARKLSPLNVKRIQASPEGGFWRDWDKTLWLDCHKKETGKTYRSVYGRMRWDDVAPTMTTYCIGLGNGRFGHPEQDRAITLREAAIFQDFPPTYQFSDPNKSLSMQTIARHIGNAVPVGLGIAIAKSIKNHLERYT
jgi:DNA (cytosine-5)-methyltransferase 1